jgi:TonB-linked SusC/RagA family outer membrane protein
VLSYNNTFNDAHSINVIVGEESVKSETYDQATTIHNFSDQSLDLVYLSNGTGSQLSTETKEGNALQSFFGRVNYDYKGKYLASAIIREDGSSKFAPKNRWSTFYSGSLGWLISKESFLENVTFLDNWKIRAGYGTNGNQDITSYAYTDKLSGQVNYPFGSTVNYGYASSSLGNENVKWETSNQYNIGTDLSFLHGMFTLTVDYFYKVNHKMLVKQTNPPSTGYTSESGSQWINNGDILNRGIEVGVEFKQRLGDFNYSIAGNIATLHNEVLKLDGVINDVSYGFTRTEKGHPIGSFYMYKMEGIFQNTSDIVKHASQGTSILPGDVKYADIDGSNTIDENDRTYVGSPIPTLTGGLTLACDYKGIDFSAFFQGVYGDKIYYEIATDIEGFYRAFPVTERYYTKHWTGDGTSNTQPRASWSASENNTRKSSRFLEDGSYLRMKNLQIGYTIPKTFTAKARIDKIRVYFSGTNLLTLTKYPGLDPEMSTNANADSGQGKDIVRNVDWGTFPSAISYNFGIQLTF